MGEAGELKLLAVEVVAVDEDTVEVDPFSLAEVALALQPLPRDPLPRWDKGRKGEEDVRPFAGRRTGIVVCLADGLGVGHERFYWVSDACQKPYSFLARRLQVGFLPADQSDPSYYTQTGLTLDRGMHTEAINIGPAPGG